jgi:hypothetical protein
MRGRAAEIADAGIFGWEVVWEALKTEPPDERSSTITQQLGLDAEHDISQGTDVPATEFSGTRNGRHVELRLGVVPFGLGKRAVNEVHIDATVVPFSAGADGDRLAAEPGAPPEVDEFLAGLAPGGAWRKASVDGGPEGILARRPVTAHPQGYVYDLWLVERLADRLGA